MLFAGVISIALTSAVDAQRPVSSRGDSEADFGPVMRAYLGYLRDEQEVVDDRISRREITPSYYRRNLNRIRALRQMAIGLVRASGNDYVPELEAVAADEFKTLFENPPRIGSLRPNQVLNNRFRFLGVVRTGEPFYVFAQLNPYEQAEFMQKQASDYGRATMEVPGAQAPTGQRVGQAPTRPRRTTPH